MSADCFGEIFRQLYQLKTLFVSPFLTQWIPALCSDYVMFPLQRNRATVCIISIFLAHKASKSRFPVGVRTVHVRFSSPARSVVTVSFLWPRLKKKILQQLFTQPAFSAGTSSELQSRAAATATVRHETAVRPALLVSSSAGQRGVAAAAVTVIYSRPGTCRPCTGDRPAALWTHS